MTTADLFGNGTACMVWSTPLPGGAFGPLRYIDLMGGEKPHLLTFSTNNLGVETRVHYAPSTRFYSADRAAGQPWLGHLPFPVHVVERIETRDHVSQNRFVTRYSYRHGCFDGIEREFRGFARVDQIDTQEFAALSGGDPALNCESYSHVPEVLTRIFYHTGLSLRGDLSQEFFHEDGPCAAHLPGADLPARLSPDELRQAHRALKGALLRQEVYALDGGARSEIPYAVTERCHAVRLLQRQGPNPYAAFLTLPSEELQIHYDRATVWAKGGVIAPDDPDSCERLDPRIAHSIALETDRFGNRLKAVSIGYGRRHTDPGSGLLQPVDARNGSGITEAESHLENARYLFRSPEPPLITLTRDIHESDLDAHARSPVRARITTCFSIPVRGCVISTRPAARKGSKPSPASATPHGRDTITEPLRWMSPAP
ncbi:toxin TcdB middle/C-terminal domain-containing protein [Paracoccus xiamenensis]|uniref:toxin TcdB middle/C-terminal domain-containing protein n=1 Tax=Paracoccus xiamenensis TaxID=2714901 RepID=UPI00140744C9|nr:toxin TcdB middle/N-terminal domain-containing protein [Paracoccus xiamenensis]NHF73485.1 hypothetical protein [Paracoccus xiamenensis]